MGMEEAGERRWEVLLGWCEYIISLIDLHHFEVVHFARGQQVVWDTDRLLLFLAEAVAEVSLEQVRHESKPFESGDDFLFGRLARIGMEGTLEGSDLVVGKFFLLEQFVYLCGSQLTHNANQQPKIIKRKNHSLAPKNSILLFIVY